MLADRLWDPTTDFGLSVGKGFPRVSFVALRTNKSSVISGLGKGVAEDIAAKDPDWLSTGKFGVIQGVIRM